MTTAATTRFRVGAWAGILGPVLYVATWVIAGAAVSGYDPSRQAISELAAVGAPAQPWMTAAFVLFGLSALPFAATLRQTLPDPTLPIAVAVIITGLATAGAGAFPCSPGCPGAGTSVTDTGHSVAAVVGYLALMATPALTGVLLWRAGPGWRLFAAWSLAAAAIGAAAMLLWTLGAFGTAGGTGQRFFNTVADVWWVTAGVLALRRGQPGLVPLARSG